MIVYQLVNEYREISEILAITLAGSGASGRKDQFSDIDINIIVSEDVDIQQRQKVIKKFSDFVEIKDISFGVGEEFVLRSSNTHVDISYLNIEEVKEKLRQVVDECQANLGYSTCFWNSVQKGFVVFDRGGEYSDIRKKYNVPYPTKLRDNILSKNYIMLKGSLSSYYNQISKAIKRKDLFSVNYRVIGFLDSYFDIIFAINMIAHPGEKRLVTLIDGKCGKKPHNFSENINKLLESAAYCSSEILDNLNLILIELDKLLKSEKLLI